MIYCKNENYELRSGSMLDELKELDTNSIDSIVTDPPYELGFMGKSWDSSGVAFQKETWEKCLNVLKPGGYLLAFGGSRTYHRIACAIEDAGFEIRDTIMWIYGSGFPKSMNIGLAIDKCNKVANNEWSGWGTCLKPSYEPIIVARKPVEGSVTQNVIKWGVGGINIDECRIGSDVVGGGTMPKLTDVGASNSIRNGMSFGQVENAERVPYEEHVGRFPANTILTYDDSDFDEVCGGFPNTKSVSHASNRVGRTEESVFNNNVSGFDNTYYNGVEFGYTDEGSASRYFYCAKASKKDRDEGLDSFDERTRKTVEGAGPVSERLDFDESNVHSEYDKKFVTISKNIHPTVKPTELMQYLVRLVTPKGGTVLDPFMGSGSTGKATMIENNDRNAEYKFIGVELTDEYLPIAQARIEYGVNYKEEKMKENMSDSEKEIAEAKVNLW